MAESLIKPIVYRDYYIVPSKLDGGRKYGTEVRLLHVKGSAVEGFPILDSFPFVPGIFSSEAGAMKDAQTFIDQKHRHDEPVASFVFPASSDNL